MNRLILALLLTLPAAAMAQSNTIVINVTMTCQDFGGRCSGQMTIPVPGSLAPLSLANNAWAPYLHSVPPVVTGKFVDGAVVLDQTSAAEKSNESPEVTAFKDCVSSGVTECDLNVVIGNP
jgi:hypothetical protein